MLTEATDSLLGMLKFKDLGVPRDLGDLGDLGGVVDVGLLDPLFQTFLSLPGTPVIPWI